MTAQVPANRRVPRSQAWSFALIALLLAATPMLSARAPLQGSDQDLATRALVEAARSSDLPAMVSSIEAGARLNGTAAGYDTALIAAARGGRLDAVRMLIERGADPNLAGAGTSTPLTVAAREGHTAVVEELLDRGASIEYVAEGEGTALTQASGAGRLDIVRLLVARGANVNVRTRDSVVVQSAQIVYDNLGRSRELPVRRLQILERSPLSAARRGGHDAVAAVLVSAGAQE